MKRKSFIVSSAVIAAGLPVAYYFSKHKWKNNNPLIRPDVLSHFCDENAIREIGLLYRNRTPGENQKEKLMQLLLTDNAGNKVKPNDRSMIAELLDKKIQEEFAQYKTIIINGWIISTTEARQCALFSFTKN